jgi:enamine deaminase RidA (YjgF/YER057c/UK114 family)
MAATNTTDRRQALQAFDDTKAGVKGLVDAGVTTVPPIFHHPPDSLPTSSSSVTIPVIDLSARRADVVAQVKAACGDLNNVARCLKLNVFIAATADFTRQPEVANGASELIGAVFGEAGRHARSSVGVASLPKGAQVEIEVIAMSGDDSFESKTVGDTSG